MINIPISIGELFDKITILEIKSVRVEDDLKLNNITKELQMLSNIAPECDTKLYMKLKTTNEQLWDVEENLRQKERNNEFDDDFIQLARSVYILNDQRADIKYMINKLYNSELVEEKSYG